MSLVPRYPNLQSAIGTTIPVVTSLMAATSVALVVVPLSAQSSGKCLRFTTWGSDQGGVIFGTLATALFIAATLAMVYSSATYGADGNSSETLYRIGRFFWINGVSAFALTLGCLALERVWWELPVMAGMSLTAALLNVFDSNGTGLERIVSVFVAAASLYIFITSIVNPYC